MNNSFGSSGVFSGERINGFGYGIAVSVGILFIITTILLASYFCNRSHTIPPLPRELHEPSHGHDHSTIAIEATGLDEATLQSYPKLLYSQAKFRNNDTTASCCSICLADYKETDMLRSLPDCAHLFHRRCVDAWLRLHPTCPICRTSPLPTPLPTPLSEMVPLASRVQS